MTSQNPRDMREWMTQVERIGRQQRGLPALIQKTVAPIIEDAEKDKVRHPAAPIELTYQTAVYLDVTGRRRVRFLMDFPDVVFNTDGTDAAIQQYELWGRNETPSVLAGTVSSLPGSSLPGSTLPGLVATAENESIAAEEKPYALVGTNLESFFRVDDFTPNSIWRFRARAIGVSTTTPGDWSAELVVQMLADTTPPPQPTAPTLLIQRGTITALWDGQAVNGSMPADFKYAVLAHGTASSPTREIARFGRGGGSKVVADIDYYDPQFFRLAAVDESGNLGPWSEQAVGYTTPLVDRDVILSTIDAAKTHLKNINAGVSILPNTIITEHLVVTEEMSAAIGNFLYLNADKINVNSLAADTVFTGLLDAVLVVADMFEGKSFTGGTFTGGRFQNSVEEYSGFKIDPTGILGYAPGGTGVETFRLDAATGSLTANSGTLTGLKYQTHTAANTGIKIDPTLGYKHYNTSNQLMVDISGNSATFTGTIKSGFGTTHAAISDNTGFGRPGLKLPVNGTDVWGAQVVSAGAAEGWAAGTLMLTSAKAAAGDYYAGLWLQKGGGWTLGDHASGTTGSRIFASGGQIRAEAPGTGQGVLVVGVNSWLQAGSGIIQAESNGALTLSGNGTTIYGGLNVSGSKNFVMDHPTKPGMELLHGATESPVSGVQYWGCAEIGADGTALVRLPEYFTALVKPGSACIGVNGNGAVVGWDTEVIDNSFEVRGPAGTAFTWDVKAERLGADFAVERTKVVWTPPGDVIE